MTYISGYFPLMSLNKWKNEYLDCFLLNIKLISLKNRKNKKYKIIKTIKKKAKNKIILRINSDDGNSIISHAKYA